MFLLGFAVVVFAGKVAFPVTTGVVAVPDGMYLSGAVVGMLNGLIGIGLVLIYRANRIINFAHGALGAFAATLTSELFETTGWPYLAAIAAGLVAAIVSSAIVEFLVIRRFRNAPRLILTVATIGLAQIMGFLELIVPAAFRGEDASEQLRARINSPWDIRFDWGVVPFTADHIVVIVVGPIALLGLALFFRFTRYGIAARASAENAERARLLGIRVSRVSLVVWVIAGFLSALTAILRAPVLGFQFSALGGQSLLIRALAAAVIARMESLPTTVAAAMLLTMGEQTLFFSTGKSGYTDLFMFGVILVALLVQRNRLGRVDLGASSWRAVQEVRSTPRELAGFPEVRLTKFAIGAVLITAMFALPSFLRASQANIAAGVLILMMVGVSLVMLTGWSGNVSIGQWALVGVGGMLVGKIAQSANPQGFFQTVLLGGLAGAAVAVAIGLPALRIRGLFLAVTTLAFAQASHGFFFQMDILTPYNVIPRPDLPGNIDITSEHAFYYICAVALLLTLVAGRNLRRTRLGRNFVALRDNETQAQALGIRPVATKLAAFALSGFFAALAGGLLAYHQQALRFDRFPVTESLVVFSMAVIGGLGSLSGAILGAGYIKTVQLVLPPAFQLLATGFGMMLLLLLFPGGLGEVLFRWRDRFLRRVAERRGVIVPSLLADVREPDADVLTKAAGSTKALAGSRR